MKYYAFKQIVAYLQRFKRITQAHRVADNIIKISFDGKESICFDLQKGDPSIYIRSESVRLKYYQAPFDVLLQKFVARSDIHRCEIANEDKVLRLEVMQSGAYKASTTILQLEFTGKYTNAILIDEDGMVMDALRHVDSLNSYREIKPGVMLEPLKAPVFTAKPGEQIEDIAAFLTQTYYDRLALLLHRRKSVEIARIEKKIERLQTTLDQLHDEQLLLDEADEYMQKGNLALANMHLIKPYTRSVQLIDFDGNEIELELPEGMRSSSEAGNLFFKRAKKAKQRALNLHIERENLNEKIDFLQRFKNNIALADSIESIDMLLPPQKKKEKREAPKSYETFWIQGHKVLLGKNKKGNAELLKIARAGDIWMHVKEMPSSHVIIQTSKQNVSEQLLEAAAKLCVDFSTTKVGTFLVDYTFRREVKVQSEANVLYNKYKTLSVRKER